MRIFLLLFFFTAISPTDFTKVQLHLHVEYINKTEAHVTCLQLPKNRSGVESYVLYNQAYPNKTINDSSFTAAHLSVQQEVTVGCGQQKNLSENSINVTLSPLNDDEEDSICNTIGSDSVMLLKCHSKLDCWKLSLNVSNEDTNCSASNKPGIISIFPPSLYADGTIKLEDVSILLRDMEVGYNFSNLENSCVKVIGSVCNHLDITPSATPESACPQPTSCAEQIPCVEPGATDALNQIIQDKPTYVLVSFIILMVMIALLVLAIVIILICLARRFCKRNWCEKGEQMCGSIPTKEKSPIVLDSTPTSTMNPTTIEMSTAFSENDTSSLGKEQIDSEKKK